MELVLLFMQKVERTKKKTNKLLYLLGTFLILCSILILTYNYFFVFIQNKHNNGMIKSYLKEDLSNISTNETTQKNKVKTSENYLAILEIPKINLKRGIFDKNSSKNNVNKNIYVVKETTLPDEYENSHIILASHSGNSSVSFFRNLKKLDMKDKILFYYNGYKYIYEVSNRYEIPKTGKAQLIQSNSSDITLITCITGTKKQVVYLGELIAKEQY